MAETKSPFCSDFSPVSGATTTLESSKSARMFEGIQFWPAVLGEQIYSLGFS